MLIVILELLYAAIKKMCVLYKIGGSTQLIRNTFLKKLTYPEYIPNW